MNFIIKRGNFDTNYCYLGSKNKDHNIDFKEKLRKFGENGRQTLKIRIITKAPDDYVKNRPTCNPTHFFVKM
jgi:hypothetical protein